MRKLPLIISLMLLVTAVASSVASYDRARQCLEDDLRQAMSLTIRERGYERMRQDSIRAYRLLLSSAAAGNRKQNDWNNKLDGRSSVLTVGNNNNAARSHKPNDGNGVLTVADPVFKKHIKTVALRPKAFVAYHITPHRDDFDVRMEGRACYSMAFVWSMSDQRLPLFLCLMTLLSLLLSVRRRAAAVADPPMAAMHLTPMQEQLMQMFIEAPGHRLTKQEICDALWPNKDNAAETLYTTIRRLRNELRERSEWEIETERGRSYELRKKQNSLTD